MRALSLSSVPADVRERGGFIAAALSGRTATDSPGLVVLYDAEAQGISPEDGGRYALVCETHNTLMQDTNLRRIRGHLTAPDFCDCCRGTCGAGCSDCGRR